MNPNFWEWDFPGGPVLKNAPSNAQGPGSIPGQRTRIPHAAGLSQKKKKRISRSDLSISMF